ncbi:hypothetical protein AURDEDRAFT_186494 [Auricularia subglabra TFB-10046 SS5]|nr:hypothetical protein AURDEDRAFT_186494 [Auricularia subglabra TFB-10046 SS5]
MAAQATDQASLDFLQVGLGLTPSDEELEAADIVEAGEPRRTAPPGRASDRRPAQAWKNWPENCRNFNAVLDDANELRAYFCPQPNCRRICNRPKVFHISEYLATGACTFDERINTGELEKRFGEYERLRALPAQDPKRVMFRVFFPCAHYGGESTRTPCMRRFLSFCQAPIGVALTLKADNFGLGFQAFTESVSLSSVTQTNILHCWMKCPVQLLHKDFLADLDVYSDHLQRVHTREAKRDLDIGGFRNPALYLMYNYDTGEVIVLTMSHSPIFRRLQQACAASPTVRPNEDPFVLLVIFYACLLHAARRTAMLWRVRVSKDAKKFTVQSGNNHEKLLEEFTRDRRHNLRSGNSMRGIAQDIEIIRREHAKFRTLRAVDDALFQSIEASLDTQHALALQLARVYGDCADATQTSIEVLLGFSQLHNGLKMYEIAEDNRKQAEATEAIARDAKRDSEIMKTITVVTLVYLPATFVSTLLSMGIFDFGGGAVRIARDGWLFFAISIPLTVLTLSLAYAWQRFTAPPERRAPRPSEPVVVAAEGKPPYSKSPTSMTLFDRIHLTRRKTIYDTTEDSGLLPR